MSETVHYKGKLEKISVGVVPSKELAEKILEEKDAKKVDYYSDPLEHLCDWYNEEYFYHSFSETLI